MWLQLHPEWLHRLPPTDKAAHIYLFIYLIIYFYFYFFSSIHVFICAKSQETVTWTARARGWQRLCGLSLPHMSQREARWETIDRNVECKRQVRAEEVRAGARKGHLSCAIRICTCRQVWVQLTHLAFVFGAVAQMNHRTRMGFCRSATQRAEGAGRREEGGVVKIR